MKVWKNLGKKRQELPTIMVGEKWDCNPVAKKTRRDQKGREIAAMRVQNRVVEEEQREREVWA